MASIAFEGVCSDLRRTDKTDRMTEIVANASSG